MTKVFGITAILKSDPRRKKYLLIAAISDHAVREFMEGQMGLLWDLEIVQYTQLECVVRKMKPEIIDQKTL